MDWAYHVQYGLHPRIGVFPSPQPWERGASVVIRSRRGTELGRVISEAESPSRLDREDAPQILRAATSADLVAVRGANGSQRELYATFRSVFDEAVWPIQLIDVEPLLSPDETVLYYLGPHRLDFGGLSEAFRSRLGLRVAFEPLGKDVEPEAEPVGGGCGSCGEGGCGSCGDGNTDGSGCGSCDPVGSSRETHA